LPFRRAAGGVILAVRLTPKASADAVMGVETFGSELVLKARVRALPEDGRANQALARLIAGWLDVPASSVAIAHGGKSRLKQVKIEGDTDRLARLIEARVAGFT
jgi:uncharacterized protein (TIGR00251 family)